MSCPDNALREKINETLFPIYRGETEAQPVFKLSTSEFEEAFGELSYTAGQSNFLMM
mgnify:FL=1